MPQKNTESLLTFDVKTVLGVDFKAPYHFKLMQNIYHAQAKITTDTKYLVFQHNTTGFKLGVSALFLKQLKETDFYDVTDINQTREREFETDVHKQSLFRISLECFFTYCWAAITSTCRELWSVYALKLKSDSVYFYNVKKELESSYPNARITNYFLTINKEDWFMYLNGARNTVEHGQILMLEFRGDIGRVVIADEQNVDIDSLTTNKKYEPMNWCQTIFDETCKFVDICSKDLNTLLFG